MEISVFFDNFSTMTPKPDTKIAAAVGTTDMSKLHNASSEDPYAWKIVWRNVLFFAYLHYAAVRGLYIIFSGQILFYTYLWTVFLFVFGAVGVTGGSHRLWSHRAYKARFPLRTILMLLQTVAFQNHIYEWSRDHRGHHKFMDTDADPHNIKRGFFFAHMGWLLIRKHPDVRIKGAGIDLSDLERDPVVMFQKKYYRVLMPLIAFVMPAAVPAMLWGESGWAAWYVCSTARYTVGVHGTWCINSVAHMFGTRPIDKSMTPTQNVFLGTFGLGEGWHNYHHVFPWDYKAAELGNISGNFTAAFIDFFARIGWAYDLKTVSKDMIDRRMRRTGDGSHPRAHITVDSSQDDASHHHDRGEEIWGWGDKDMSQEDRLAADIFKQEKSTTVRDSFLRAEKAR